MVRGSKRNIIILCADEMRGDCLPANGLLTGVRTPALDALGDRGVVLTRHFTPSPKCVPARISMATGRYCRAIGARSAYQTIPPSEPDLLSALLNAGYEAAIFGKGNVWGNFDGDGRVAIKHHSGVEPYATIGQRCQTPTANPTKSLHRNGLEIVACAEAEIPDVGTTEQAIEFLGKRRDRSKRFFLQVNLRNPHPPYRISEPFFSMYDPGDIAPFPNALPAGAPLPLRCNAAVRLGSDVEPETLRRIQAVYFGMISFVDTQLARIAEAIEREKLWAETTVLFCSDHGDFAGQYGCWEKWDTCFPDCLTQVPCILVDPELGRGLRYDHLSDHTDLFPTLAGLAGVPAPDDLHGMDLVPYLADNRAVREAVFSEGGHEASARRRVADPGTGVPRNEKQQTYWECPETMARAAMIRTETHKLVLRETGGNELYDLTSDRWEMRNRFDDPALAGVQGRMLEQMVEWMLRTAPDRPGVEPVWA